MYVFDRSEFNHFIITCKQTMSKDLQKHEDNLHEGNRGHEGGRDQLIEKHL